MKHFHDSIHGWFNFDNIYKSVVENSSDGAHFVEVGSWKGKSAAFMCVEIFNSKKTIKFDCIDIWSGVGNEYQKDRSVINQTLYEEFLKNMEPVNGLFTPIREWSDKAAALYKDNSLDFVFIDAGHEYENIISDIKAWDPKVKSGGIIAGHDYSTAEGVNRAVNEYFKNRFECNRTSWVVNK